MLGGVAFRSVSCPTPGGLAVGARGAVEPVSVPAPGAGLAGTVGEVPPGAGQAEPLGPTPLPLLLPDVPTDEDPPEVCAQAGPAAMAPSTQRAVRILSVICSS